MECGKEKLTRLVEGLKARGLTGRGTYSRIAERTGYTPGMVGKVLNGKAELTDRFVQLVCSAFDIDREWVEAGRESPDQPHETADSELLPRGAANKVDAVVPGLSCGLKDQAVVEGIRELLKMPEPDRWEAVAMLKRLSQGRGN